MGQIEQFAIAGRLVPDGFGHVDDHVGRFVPGQEDADFGLPLWPDRPVEEPDPRMASARVGQHQQRRVVRADRFRLGTDIEPFHRRGDFVDRQPSGRGDLGRCETVMPDHVLQPALQIVVVLRSAGVVRRLGGCRQGDEQDHRENGDSHQYVPVVRASVHRSPFSGRACPTWRLGGWGRVTHRLKQESYFSVAPCQSAPSVASRPPRGKLTRYFPINNTGRTIPPRNNSVIWE
ncbi:MAG: hypothetical protein HQ567_23130 [Candidatus Nealsonbacteria bacterium]|nr:hypothetical protein [Candidatus Nealsonbacteria bacterium]